ncbi:hypothetical protein LM800396_140072 [Listeria monocytogenes]|nr:hypothetical protein X844_0031 [Listeria monocytogenes Lm_1823]EXL19868.1 hypothetical protein X847_2879 [Listeria monocytogenes Lm_1889]CUL57084.1 hypothetical protein LM800396_140072 [Listeria monocytogenes]CUL76522.1 hypothetical protein LM801457_50044 [Listeria monocytogenes]
MLRNKFLIWSRDEAKGSKIDDLHGKTGNHSQFSVLAFCEEVAREYRDIA